MNPLSEEKKYLSGSTSKKYLASYLCKRLSKSCESKQVIITFSIIQDTLLAMDRIWKHYLRIQIQRRIQELIIYIYSTTMKYIKIRSNTVRKRTIEKENSRFLYEQHLLATHRNSFQSKLAASTKNYLL